MDVTTRRWSSLGLLVAALASAWVPQEAAAREGEGWRDRPARDARDAHRGRARAREAVRATPLPPMPQPQLPTLRPEPAMPFVMERGADAPGVDRWGRPLRLSPDERRALRQQINDAERNVYRPQRP